MFALLIGGTGCWSSHTTCLSAVWGRPILGEYLIAPIPCSQLLQGCFCHLSFRKQLSKGLGDSGIFQCLLSVSAAFQDHYCYSLQQCIIALDLMVKIHSLKQHSLLLTLRACTHPDQFHWRNSSFYLKHILLSSPSFQTETFGLHLNHSKQHFLSFHVNTH